MTGCGLLNLAGYGPGWAWRVLLAVHGRAGAWWGLSVPGHGLGCACTAVGPRARWPASISVWRGSMAFKRGLCTTGGAAWF